MKAYSKALIFTFCVVFTMLIVACSFTVEERYIEIKYSNFTGSMEKEFNLNTYDNTLNMSGTLELSDGTVYLSVLAKNSGDELYSLTVTPKDNGKININIDLNEQRNLLFRVTGENAKDFTIKLNSEQKLVLDKVKPETPSIPEK